MLRRVALVRTDVSEEPSASFIRVTRIGELGTILDDRSAWDWATEFVELADELSSAELLVSVARV
jgi:hypothetical protein